MTDDKPGRVERAAENAMLKLAARGAMVLVIPMVSFFGVELWGMARDAGKAIGEIRGDVRALTSQITAQISGHDLRLSSLERKNEEQDSRMNSLSEQVYRWRPAVPAPAEEQQRQQWQRR